MSNSRKAVHIENFSKIRRRAYTFIWKVSDAMCIDLECKSHVYAAIAYAKSRLYCL